MVSSLLVDALTNPTEALLDLDKSTGNVQELPQRAAKYFGDIFASDDAFNEIPRLDLQHPPESFKPRALVRFDSMVQDTSCSSEIYLSRRANGECGGWGLNEDLDANAGAQLANVDYNLLKECHVFWAVTIPGQADWWGASKPVVAHSLVPSQPHKFPVPSEPHISAQVKIYEAQLAESLRTTDLVSFIGILTSEPRNISLDAPTTLVPTIHVLSVRNIPLTPVPSQFPGASLPLPVEATREKLITWIAEEGLAGDRLAAEWVFLCLLDKVKSRSPPLLPASLTLSGYAYSASATPKLTHVLAQLVPLLTVVPLSLDVVNNTPFFPESKEEDLHSGWLQLPKGSLCVVSETVLNEGSVSEKGLLNLKQLQEMMMNQTLDYVFPFSRYSFETDVNFLVLVSGKKSAFFKTHLHIPVLARDASAPSVEELSVIDKSIQLPPPELLSEFRKLIGGAKVSSVTLGEATATLIQEDFVRERQAAQTHKNARNAEGLVTSDDLIIRMMVAKLLAASLHMGEVTSDIWARAKKLEGERRARTL